MKYIKKKKKQFYWRKTSRDWVQIQEGKSRIVTSLILDYGERTRLTSAKCSSILDCDEIWLWRPSCHYPEGLASNLTPFYDRTGIEFAAEERFGSNRILRSFPPTYKKI